MITHKLATLCYIVYNEEILLLYRNKKINDFHQNKYIGIGGRLEPGETPNECIIRELKEETGYYVQPKDLIFRGYIYFDEVNRDKAKEDLPAFNWLVFLYLVYVDKKMKFKNPEGELKWFNISDIPYEKMWEGDRHFTPEILASDNVVIEGKFLYEGEKIVKWDFGREKFSKVK